MTRGSLPSSGSMRSSSISGAWYWWLDEAAILALVARSRWSGSLGGDRATGAPLLLLFMSSPLWRRGYVFPSE